MVSNPVRVGPWRLNMAGLNGDTTTPDTAADPLGLSDVRGSWWWDPTGTNPDERGVLQWPAPPYAVLVTSFRGARLRVVRVEVLAADGDLHRDVLRDLGRDLDRLAAEQHRQAYRDRRSIDTLTRSRRVRLTREHLSEVARVYREGGTRGTRAVAVKWGLATRTAENWVRRARDAGLLGVPPGPGKAGEQPTTARTRTRKGSAR